MISARFIQVVVFITRYEFYKTSSCCWWVTAVKLRACDCTCMYRTIILQLMALLAH